MLNRRPKLICQIATQANIASNPRERIHISTIVRIIINVIKAHIHRYHWTFLAVTRIRGHQYLADDGDVSTVQGLCWHSYYC